MKKISVKQITVAATFASLAVILDVLSAHTESTKYTLYALPLLLSGMLFGPWVGLLTGFVSGFLSQLFSIYGLSITTFLWMIAPMAWGFVSGLLFHKVTKKKESLLSIFFIVILSSLLVTLINTLALYLDGLILHYPTPYIIMQLGGRILTSLFLSVIYSFLIYSIYPRIKNIANL